MRRSLTSLGILVLFAGFTIPALAIQVHLEPVAEGLASPVLLTHAGDGTGDLYIVEQPGRIRTIKDGVLQREPLLDISDRVYRGHTAAGGQGLLSLAFHPDFQSNGQFYVFYTAHTEKVDSLFDIVVEGFRVARSEEGSSVDSMGTLLRIAHSKDDYAGGGMAFGPDGRLYVGAGGSGSVLRMEVDAALELSGPALSRSLRLPAIEFSETGNLINPRHISFDPSASSQLFLTDSEGEGSGVLRLYPNGWSDLAYPSSMSDGRLPVIRPIDEHPGREFLGGYLYRGVDAPLLSDSFILGYRDSSREAIAGLYIVKELLPGNWYGFDLFVADSPGGTLGRRLTGLGQDEEGEVYVLSSDKLGAEGENGKVQRISFADDLTPLPVTHMVSVSGITFSPDTTIVNPGDTVQWNWGSGLHDVESGQIMGGTGIHDGKFDSGAPVTAPNTYNLTFSFTFLASTPPDAGGLYPYYCSVHDGLGMSGRVIVKPTLSGQGFTLDTPLNYP